MEALMSSVYRVDCGDACSISYYDSGPPVVPSRPLVLLHGLASTWTAWILTLPHLLGKRRVLAPDLPGHGESGALDSAADLSQVASVLAAWMEHLDLGSADLAGASLGALLALELAATRPHQAASLTLLAPPAPSALEAAAVHLRGWQRADGTVRMETVDELAVITPQATPSLLTLANLGLARCRAFGSTMQALAAYPMEDRCTQVQCPVTLLWGDEDRLVPVASATWWQERFPDAALRICPSTGHNPAFDAPEVTAAALLASR